MFIQKMETGHKRVKVLVVSIEDTKEQHEMTKAAYNSIVSEENIIDVSIDTRKHSIHTGIKWDLRAKWNDWFDWFRDTNEYDYLLYVSNDNLLHTKCVDHLVRYFENDADGSVGCIAPNTVWSLEEFHKLGDVEYSTNLMKEMHCSTFMMKPGVIEKVGRMKERYPLEFLDRDWFYRCKLAGYQCVGVDMPLVYHPKQSITTGNSNDRLDIAKRKYIAEWGGDALQEKYTFPYNDMNNPQFECWDYPDYSYSFKQ